MIVLVFLEIGAWVNILYIQLLDVCGGFCRLAFINVVERDLGVPFVIRRSRDIGEELPTIYSLRFPSVNPGDQRRLRRVVRPAEPRNDILWTKRLYRLIGRKCSQRLLLLRVYIFPERCIAV